MDLKAVLDHMKYLNLHFEIDLELMVSTDSTNSMKVEEEYCIWELGSPGFRSKCLNEIVMEMDRLTLEKNERD